jgi:hypothetical protein
MTCTPFRSPDGKTIGFICTRGGKPRAPCLYCRTTHEFLCDHRDKPKAKRCSRKLCRVHAHEIGDNLHVCPDHVAAKDAPAPRRSDEPLQVHTGNCNKHRGDPDAFDVTFGSGGIEGKPFAPSAVIFKEVRKAITEITMLELTAKIELDTWPDKAKAKLEKAERIKREFWTKYRRQFLAEMLVSSGSLVPADWKTDVTEARARGVTAHHNAWERLLVRKRVVLLCYCETRVLCHRRLLAEILVRMGAVDAGELPTPEKDANQVKLFAEGT